MTADVTAGAAEQGEPDTDDAALDRLKRFGGQKLLGEMIGLFLVAAPGRISAARAGVRASDGPGVEMALHSLKSSAAQLGAMRMQRLSARGEELARAGQVGSVGPIIDDVDEEWGRVRAWLTGIRDGGRA